MLKEFSEKIMETLMHSMEAVDKNGHRDHKARLTACKQSIDFFDKLFSDMKPEDKKILGESLTSDMKGKMEAVSQEEEEYRKVMEKRRKEREKEKEGTQKDKEKKKKEDKKKEDAEYEEIFDQKEEQEPENDEKGETDGTDEDTKEIS